MGYRNLSLLCMLLLTSFGLSETALACPFCTAQSQTLTEEMESMDAVVLAKLVEPAPAESNDPAAPVQREIRNNGMPQGGNLGAYEAKN